MLLGLLPDFICTFLGLLSRFIHALLYNFFRSPTGLLGSGSGGLSGFFYILARAFDVVLRGLGFRGPGEARDYDCTENFSSHASN